MLADLSRVSAIWLVNSVRKWRRAVLIEPEAESDDQAALVGMKSNQLSRQ
jgi:hypothetical protein